MKGTEKQVRWAESIRESYAKVAEILREAIEALADLTQKNVTLQSDPLAKGGGGSDAVGKHYIKNLNPGHEAAIGAAEPWYPGKRGPFDHPRKWAHERAEVLVEQGDPHAYRRAEKEFIEATMKNLETALVEESNARYWIDRRAE